jgi:hypothetical protein
LVPLTNVPLLNDDWAVPETVPDIPLTEGADQLYVVPLGTTVEDKGEPFEGVNEYEPPEQITSV